MIALLVLLAGLAPVQANPQETADCAARALQSDQLVCADPELKALDDRVRNALAPTATAYVETPSSWFGRSRTCTHAADHRACLTQAYADRLAVIEAALWAKPAVEAGLKCDGAWRRKALTARLPEANRMLVVRENGAILAIASPGAGGPWKPYVQWSLSKDRVVFRPLFGPAITCRTQTF